MIRDDDDPHHIFFFGRQSVGRVASAGNCERWGRTVSSVAVGALVLFFIDRSDAVAAPVVAEKRSRRRGWSTRSQ
jgi:hypothetical protein